MNMYIYIYEHAYVGVLISRNMIQPIPLGVTFSNAVSKAQSSKLERLFSLKRGKRDVRALSLELSKMSPQVGLGVVSHGYTLIPVSHMYIDHRMYIN